MMTASEVAEMNKYCTIIFNIGALQVISVNR